MLAILVALSVGVCAADDRHPVAEEQAITVSATAENMIRLPSQWPEYFGTHYAGTPEGTGRWWNTVRSYGGTHTGVYATDDSPQHVGPFTGRKVRVGLSDFHSRFNRSGRSAEQLIPDLIEHRFTAIYLISDGLDTNATRLLVALVPKKDTEFSLGDVRLDLPERIPHSGWSADAIQFSATSLPHKTVAPVASEEMELRVSIGKSVTEPMLLLLRQPDTEGTSR
jgi:hypothetical protein